MTLRDRGEPNVARPNAIPVHGVPDEETGRVLIRTVARQMWDGRMVCTLSSFVKDDVTTITPTGEVMENILQGWGRG